MKKIVFFVLLIWVFISCKKANETDYPVLSVDITKRNIPSVFDIFSKIEIIPLETTDSSLLGERSINITSYNNHYYTLNQPVPSVFVFYCFDEQGKFIRQIGSRGQGPEEYNYVNSYVINKSDNTVELLSPFGYIYTYELTGKFVGKKRLPDLVPNYQDIKLLNDSLRILTSSVGNNEDQLYVYSTKSNTIVNSFYQENPAISPIYTSQLYQYNDSIYFFAPLVSTVFKINQHGYEVAYAWDFGAMNPENTKLDSDITKQHLSELLHDSQIKGIYICPFQNDTYYYTQFSRYVDQVIAPPINVFYDKRNNKKYVFETFKEDLSFFPVYWCNDYVLASSATVLFNSVTNTEMPNKKVIPSVLDEENRKKLEAMQEDDNPFIIKYYFK